MPFGNRAGMADTLGRDADQAGAKMAVGPSPPRRPQPSITRNGTVLVTGRLRSCDLVVAFSPPLSATSLSVSIGTCSRPSRWCRSSLQYRLRSGRSMVTLRREPVMGAMFTRRFGCCGVRREFQLFAANLNRRWELLLRLLQLLKSGAIYFAMVFSVGFVLGPIRILWLEPRLGVRTAELIEAPFMLLVVISAGRWVGRRLCAGCSPAARLGVGLVAAGTVLVADLAVGVGLRGMSALEVFNARDPVSGSVYYALVALTAVAPWVFGRASTTVPNEPAEPPRGRIP